VKAVELQSGKDLASVCFGSVDRSHTSKEHRCIKKGIPRCLHFVVLDRLVVLDGLVVLEVPVSDHSGTKRHTNKRNSDQKVAEHPQEECTSGQWWVITMSVHRVVIY